MKGVRINKMLIVDDEESLCEMIHIILKDEECQIDCLPRIVLLDNYLPDGRGIDMIENDISLLNNCKVTMITGDDLPATRKKAKILGVNYFIQKPFSLKLIKELMDQVID